MGRIGPKVLVKYLFQRASEERQAAMNCSDERVRQVHIDLAERYDEAASLNERGSRRTLKVVS